MAEFNNVVIAHAAVSSRMMTNFGRLFTQELVALGADVHFFASRLPVYGSGPDLNEMRQMAIKFHGLDLPQHLAPFAELRALISMTKDFRRLKVRVLHTRASVMSVIGRLAGKLAGVPCILHHQDDFHFRDPGHTRLSRSFFAGFERALSHLSSYDLFVSRSVLEAAVNAGFRKERCVLVGHDLNPSFQEGMKRSLSRPAGRHPVLRRMGVPDSCRVIGSIARLTKLKGIDTLIETAALVTSVRSDCVFFVRGDGPAWGSFDALIEQRRLRGRVILCRERIDSDDLPDLYRSFDIFMLPTRREGFGMVFAEAMAMGLPVIGPRILPITEVVPEGCGILVEPEKPGAYADALVRLLDDEALRLKIASDAHGYAHQTWVGKQAAERVVSVYRQLLHQHRLRSGA